MDKSTIKNYKGTLLHLLNIIKKSMMEDSGVVDFYRPFTKKQINYYQNPNHTAKRYKQFFVKKKLGGFRTITAPQTKTFKMILQCLNEIFKALYVPSEYAMGFTEGRSVVTNAEIHKNQNYVLNLDLKDFFPSVSQARVWKRLQLKPFEFSPEIASVIAGLCCMKEIFKDKTGKESVRYVLPQGAPTSPIITNMICDNLDRRLAGVAKRFGLRYSRYADDITFSSMHYVYQKDGEFLKELNRIIVQQGFTINDKKTRLQKHGERQEVTGIIISKKLNVSQKFVRNIRNILYIWSRYGITEAQSKFFPKYNADKGHVKNSTPDMINVLEGKLLYLKMVKGEDDSVYQRLWQQFETLKNKTIGVSISQKTKRDHSNINEILAFLEQYGFEKTQITDFLKKNTKSESITNNIKPFKYWSALDTAIFLSKFNQPNGLKYLTHDFDLQNDDAPNNMDELKKQLDVIMNQVISIPPSLFMLLNIFISGKYKNEIGESTNTWKDTFGTKHTSFFNSEEWRKWSVGNNNIHPINNPVFAPEIRAFRSTIRIDQGLLTKIVDKASEQTTLQIRKVKTDAADFYTNTFMLYLSLKKIFAGMNDRAQQNTEVNVTFKRSTDDDGTMLRNIIITHYNSFPTKSLQETIDRLNNYKDAGDFGTIRGYLNGYCLWSVESSWDNEPIRWNILKNSNMPEIEKIETQEVEGFTHILTFYLV